jgi:branched-chain amino acid transport system ATP-binding protein
MLKLNEIHTFYGRSHVLRGVSLDVTPGEIVCLLGRNGAGKSTTLKSIIGITPPKMGTVIYKGRNIVGMKPHEIARLGIAYVPEDMRIFSTLSVLDNLQIAALRSGENSWTVERVFEVFPKLAILQKSKGMALSGGERQMLAIARALMGNPDLLLMDEPSEGLAPIIVQQLDKFIKDLSKEKTILLAEQNIKFALNLAQRGYIVEKGKTVFSAGISEMQCNKQVMNKYLAV